MAKKKKEVEFVDTEAKKLDAGLYWEWRCTIEEIKSTRINEKRVHLEREIMNKEIENRKLKLALFKSTVAGARASVSKAKEEYGRMKQRIEEKIGMSLENCVIDDITFEVRKYDEPNIDED